MSQRKPLSKEEVICAKPGRASSWSRQGLNLLEAILTRVQLSPYFLSMNSGVSFLRQSRGLGGERQSFFLQNTRTWGLVLGFIGSSVYAFSKADPISVNFMGCPCMILSVEHLAGLRCCPHSPIDSYTPRSTPLFCFGTQGPGLNCTGTRLA